MTTAETIAKRFHDDGQCWYDDSRVEISIACAREAFGPDRTPDRDNYRHEETRYPFADGSAIVVCCGGWDIGFPDCPGCFCWPDANRGRHADDCQYSDELD